MQVGDFSKNGAKLFFIIIYLLKNVKVIKILAKRYLSQNLCVCFVNNSVNLFVNDSVNYFSIMTNIQLNVTHFSN